MRKKNQMTSPLKVHNSFTPKNACMLLESVSTKVDQRTERFGLLLFFVSWDHMGVKGSNDMSSETTHQIPCPKFMYILRESIYQGC